jgi:hypothetical protein
LDRFQPSFTLLIAGEYLSAFFRLEGSNLKDTAVGGVVAAQTVRRTGAAVL